MGEYIWHDRKRIIFGLPWSFTRYALTEEKLIIDTGFFNRCEDEIRIYRIMDITLKRSFWERIFGLGTIHCCTGDQTSPEVDLKHIKNARQIKDMLSDMIEQERTKRRIGVREWIDGEGDDGHEPDDEHSQE